MKNKIVELLKQIKSSQEIKIDELINGAKLCLKNAKSLHKISDLAIKNNEIGISFSLSVLAVEEISKADNMIGLAQYSNPSKIEWFIFWKQFKGGSHTTKLTNAFFLDTINFLDSYKRKITIKRIIKKYPSSKFKAEQINLTKKAGFYIDFDKSTNKFKQSQPSKKNAEKMLLLCQRKIVNTEIILNQKKEILKKCFKISQKIQTIHT